MVHGLGRRELERYMREGFCDSVMSWGFVLFWYCLCMYMFTLLIWVLLDVYYIWIYSLRWNRVEKASTAMITTQVCDFSPHALSTVCCSILQQLFPTLSSVNTPVHSGNIPHFILLLRRISLLVTYYFTWLENPRDWIYVSDVGLVRLMIFGEYLYEGI